MQSWWVGATLVAVVFAGCGGGDADAADAAPAVDATPIVRTERAYVLAKITLPRTTEEVDAASFDFPGTDFPVNKMGGLTSVLLDLVDPIPVQASVDGALEDGEALHGWLVTSADLDATDPAVSAAFGYFEDVDEPADPTNNLSGSGQLRLAAGTQRIEVIRDGSLSGGELTGQGTEDPASRFSYWIKMHPEEPARGVPGVFGSVRLTITEDGFSGASASVITQDELHADIYPGIASLMTYAIAQDVPRAAEIKGIFDANGDSEVTVQELIENDTMASLARPDVDLDGDGVNDHISQGVLVEAVRFELVE